MGCDPSQAVGHRMGASQRIKVGDWTVTPAQDLLQRAGKSIRIKPRTMDVLVYFASHAGEVISAEELIDSVWQGRVVGDGTVYQNITQLRHALGDSTEEARFIETIPKRGYRLVASVATLEPEPSEGASAMAVGQAKGRKLIFAIAGGTVLALAIGFLAFDRSSVERTRSIAVLPFADLSPNGDQEYFGDGIAEELRKELTRLDGLNVTGRTSSSSFKQSEEGAQTIGEALDVEFILEGSIRKDGNEIRIAAQLTDVANGFQIWTEDYDRDLKDLFAIQEEIATSVAGALGVRLGVGGVNAFRGAGTRNVDAYEAYLEGLAVVGTAQGQSIPFFERATRLDPNYAAAWAQLGLRTSATQWDANNPEEASEARERGYGFVLKAVELDSESAQSHSMLGTMLLGRWDWIGSEEAHAKALSLLADRSNLTQYGNMLMRAGRTAEAAIQLDAAQAVEPLGGQPTFRRLHVSLAQGRFAEAREMAEWSSAPENRLAIELNEGDSVEIKAALSAMPQTTISTTVLYSPVLSNFDTPEMVLSTLRSVYANESAEWPGKLHDIALLAAYFDDPDLAFETIAGEVRSTNVRRQALWYPIMSEMRQLPEFKELVTDLNLVEYWRAYGWADACRPLGDDDFTCS